MIALLAQSWIVLTTATVATLLGVMLAQWTADTIRRLIADHRRPSRRRGAVSRPHFGRPVDLLGAAAA